VDIRGFPGINYRRGMRAMAQKDEGEGIAINASD